MNLRKIKDLANCGFESELLLRPAKHIASPLWARQRNDIATNTMGLFDWLFEPDKEKRKRIFISFASEDIEYRNHIVD